MEEIIIKSNTANLRIYVNGKPNISNMSVSELDLLACCIELQMTEYYKRSAKIDSEKVLTK